MSDDNDGGGIEMQEQESSEQQKQQRRVDEYEEILFHLKLNRKWRRLLKHPSFPLSFWPKLLHSEWDVSIIYVLLREKILPNIEQT